MRPTSRLFLLASLGFTALGVAAAISVQSDAQPPLAQPAFPTIPLPSPDLANWVSSTPNRALPRCPYNPGARSPNAPFFAFVKTPTTCFVDGPYKWQGQDWFVQRMYVSDPANTPPHDVIRVCSRSAVHSDPNQFVPGPCQTAKGAGPLGCEICRVKGVIQTRR
jgi:hypothetical protein